MLPDAAVILRDQAEGCLLHQMNYIAARTNLPEWSLNKSARDVDWESGLADDYLSLGGGLRSGGRWVLDWINPDNTHCASLLVCSDPINLPFKSSSESRSGLIVV